MTSTTLLHQTPLFSRGPLQFLELILQAGRNIQNEEVWKRDIESEKSSKYKAERNESARTAIHVTLTIELQNHVERVS